MCISFSALYKLVLISSSRNSTVKRVIRSNDQGNKIDFGENNTFQSQCTIFKELLLATHQCKNKINFEKETRQFH